MKYFEVILFNEKDTNASNISIQQHNEKKKKKEEEREIIL